MKLQRQGTLACLALTATIALAGCGSDNPNTGNAVAPKGDCAKGSLTTQGSSAQKNAMAEWITAYQGKCKDAKIDYQPTGSGAGVEAFISGTADFAGSDSALKDDEQPKADERCKTGPAIHLPMVVGPIAVAYNLEGVNLQFKPATIAKIFAGKIKKWDDPAIKADNPDAKLPSTTIQTVHRSDESGTTDNFTKYLTAAAPTDWKFEGGKQWTAPGGVGAKGSDGVAATVKKTPGSITYIEWSFVSVSGLQAAKVANGAGEYTELTAESAGKTIGAAESTGSGDDLKLKIDYNTKEAGAYPIVLVTYEIVCEKGSPADKVKLIKSFLTYTASKDGQSKLTEIGYAPLPEQVRSKVETAAGKIA